MTLYSSHRVFVAAFTMGCWLTGAALVVAQEERSKEAATSWVEGRRIELQQYEFRREARMHTSLKMEAASLLNWTNPERDAAHGAVFLWTDQGRPQMIACAFEWNDRRNHEFSSLSQDSIAVELRGAPTHRFGPGVEFKVLPGADAPVAQRALRLTQMRRMAERFRVTAGKSETRLLTQPVFRSPPELADDVAVFLFVQGTDPECTLVLEATEKKEWRYALARQTKWGLKVLLDDESVWEAMPTNKAKEDSPFVVIPEKKFAKD
jgi:hypothetical protein